MNGCVWVRCYCGHVTFRGRSMEISSFYPVDSRLKLNSKLFHSLSHLTGLLYIHISYNEHVFYHLLTPLTLFLHSSSSICSPHLMSLKILIHFYLCVCSCVSEYMPHVCGCPQRSGRRVLDPLELELQVDSCDLPNIRCWEPNSGFLEDQKTLLALSSLHHPSF